MSTLNPKGNGVNHKDEMALEVTKEDELPSSSPSPTEELTVPKLTELEAEIVKLKTEVEKFKDLALRSQAELENYRKRVLREKEEAIRYANIDLLEHLLPVVDSFEIGLEVAKNTSDTAGLLVGMNMVREKLQDFLQENGVQSIEAIDSPFDPNLHDAVSHEHSQQVKDGYIIRQLRCGYKLRERLLRPSTVVVSKGVEGS